MTFTEDLIGLKNVISPEGIMMPRRYAISFEGSQFSVADDKIRQQTVIRMGGGTVGEMPMVNWTLAADDSICTAAGVAAAEVIRLTSETAGWALIGIDSDNLTRRRKILLNIGPQMILIGKSGAETDLSDNFIIPGDSIELPMNGAIEALWVPPIDLELGGWHLL